MNRVLPSLCLFLALCGPAVATDAPTPNPIVFPDIPAPAPVPPTPGVVTVLRADQLYVLSGDVQFLVLASPPGIVGITQAAGPVTVAGKFVDGADTFQTRTYSKKEVVLIQAIAAGRVELLVIPSGTTSADKVLRRTLDVGGVVPVPPGPGPGPIPIPEPTDEWWLPLKAAYSSESAIDLDRKKIVFLAAIWRQAATAVKTAPQTTCKAYLDVLHTATQSQLGDSLPATRKAVASVLGTVLPTSATAPLDAVTRDKSSAAFQRVSVLLDSLATVKGVR